MVQIDDVIVSLDVFREKCTPAKENAVLKGMQAHL